MATLQHIPLHPPSPPTPSVPASSATSIHLSQSPTFLIFRMRHKCKNGEDVPFGQTRPTMDDTDIFTTETNVDSSDHLAVHLYLSHDSTLSDSFATVESPRKDQSSPKSVSLTNRQEQDDPLFSSSSSMIESPLTSQGTPGEAREVTLRYSVGELLSMRHTLPFLICNIDKLNPTITSDVIKVPESAHAKPKGNSHSTRDLSSTVKKAASRLSHALNRSGESDGSHSEAKTGQWSQEDQEDVVVFRGNFASQSREQKQMWMLRKRRSSDRLSQPSAAPAGHEAQKAENFKKFYAAVISPTHLRVTAGGRIVPNTRTLPHPTLTWNADNQFFEASDCSLGPHIEHQGSWPRGTDPSSTDPHSPTAIEEPAVEDFFGPPLEPRSSVRCKAPDDKNITKIVANAALDIAKETNAKTAYSANNGDTASTRGQVKISPPDQFDVLRPFFINGQPFYPASNSSQVQNNISLVPFNMLGGMNAPYQPVLPAYGMVQPAPLQFQAGNLNYSHQVSLDPQQITQQIPLMQGFGFPPPLMAPQLQSQVGQLFNPTPTMQLSSLPREQSTLNPQVAMVVNQIQILQHQLKHLDNQLQNNKHQIDEQHVIQQQHHVQNQIRALQSGLNAQIYLPSLTQPEQYGCLGWNFGVVGTSTPLLNPTRTGLATDEAYPQGAQLVTVNGYQIYNRDNNALDNAETAIGGPGPLAGDLYTSHSFARSTQTSRKRLSAAAAMAPEFQPRSNLSTGKNSGAVKAERLVTSTEVDRIGPETSVSPQQAEAQGLSNVTNWSTPGQWPNPAVMQYSKAISNGHKLHTLKKGNSSIHPAADFQRPSTLKVPDSTERLVISAIEGTNPYLTGHPPPGVPVNMVKSADMIYSRELTKKELQARQVYWGKAPRTLSIGLPKFDGKDFYAPSPEKASDFSGEKSSKQPNNSSTTSMQSPSGSTCNVTTLPLPYEPVDAQVALPLTKSRESLIYVKFLDSSSDLDTASLDAWGMVKADEDEIFDQQGDQAASFDNKISYVDAASSARADISVPRRAAGRRGPPTFLQDMLKHSPLTTMAASTGAQSSTTVHGYLPQYSGLAAASLAPSINSISVPGMPRNNHRSLRTENQPLPRNSHRQVGVSAAENLRKLKGKEKEKETMRHGSNSKIEVLGPEYHDSAS